MAKVLCLIDGECIEVEEDALERRTGIDETPNETANWVEYWKDGTLVHRSVHVDLKVGLGSLLDQASFG